MMHKLNRTAVNAVLEMQIVPTDEKGPNAKEP